MKSFTTIFTSYKFFQIFILSIISGMPFSLLYTSFAAWLTENGIDIAVITTFAFARTPYSLKFIWAPFVDNLRIPILHDILGKRRSFMVITSISIASLLFYISRLDPRLDLNLIRLLSICIGFMAATYDISWDAMRIEMLSEEEQSLGVAVTSFGYRMGAFITGAVALKLSSVYENWVSVYEIISIIFVLGFFFILTINNKTKVAKPIRTSELHEIIIKPLKEFFSRDKAFIILLGLVLYKTGDAMLSNVGINFYLKMGFSKNEIAKVVKVYAMVASILGSYLASYICVRLGNFNGLLICGVLEMLTNFLYIWIHHEPTYNVFVFCCVSENFTAGMGATALVTYISNLCNRKYTATHYSLLSSATAFMNSTLTSYAGTLVNKLGWDNYFIFTVIISLPALFILYYIKKVTEKVT